MSDTNEKLDTGKDEDFEGHRIDEKLADQRLDQRLDRTDDVAEPDFEGHRFDNKFDERLES